MLKPVILVRICSMFMFVGRRTSIVE